MRLMLCGIARDALPFLIPFTRVLNLTLCLSPRHSDHYIRTFMESQYTKRRSKQSDRGRISFGYREQKENTWGMPALNPTSCFFDSHQACVALRGRGLGIFATSKNTSERSRPLRLMAEVRSRMWPAMQPCPSPSSTNAHLGSSTLSGDHRYDSLPGICLQGGSDA
jgi:hypothetical protein